MGWNIHEYPATKLMFQPEKSNPRKDLLITSSDLLYIWSIDRENYIHKELAISHVLRTYYARKRTNQYALL